MSNDLVNASNGAGELDTFETFDNPDTELDTFDSGNYTEGPIDNQGEEDEGESIDTDSQVNTLEEEEENPSEFEEEESEEESDKGSEVEDKENGKESEQSKDGDKSENLPEKEAKDADVKTIKAFREGKAYEIPQDAEVKVKVAGKSEKVSIQELRDNYSGKVQYDKKFSELGENQKTFEKEFTKYNQEKELLSSELKEVKQLAMEGLEGKVSPLQFVEKMLDFMGVDPYDYNKNLRDYLSEETALLNQLSPEQREAYWIQQKNQYLLQKQESLLKRQSDQQALAEMERETAQLREAHGISQGDYEAATEELKDLGYEGVEPQKIIEYAATVPLATKAVEFLSPYEEQIADSEYDAVTGEIINLLKNGTSEEFVKKLLAEEYQVETVISQVKDKESRKPKKSKAGSSPKKSEFESFDDFEDFGQDLYY